MILVALVAKNAPADAGDRDEGWSLGREGPLEKETAAPSSALAWRLPWTEEPGGLQSTGQQRLRHSDSTFTLTSAGDMGLIPGLGRSHTLQSN